MVTKSNDKNKHKQLKRANVAKWVTGGVLQNATSPTLKIYKLATLRPWQAYTEATASGVCGQRQGQAIAAHAYQGGRQVVFATPQTQLAG